MRKTSPNGLVENGWPGPLTQPSRKPAAPVQRPGRRGRTIFPEPAAEPVADEVVEPATDVENEEAT